MLFPEFRIYINNIIIKVLCITSYINILFLILLSSFLVNFFYNFISSFLMYDSIALKTIFIDLMLSDASVSGFIPLTRAS